MGESVTAHKVASTCVVELAASPILGGRVGQLKTFKLGFYPAAVLPLIIAFAVDAANTVGDITASEVRLHPRLPSLQVSNFGLSQRS